MAAATHQTPMNGSSVASGSSTFSHCTVALPRQAGPDQRLGHVLAVAVAPADPPAVRSLLGEVAHDGLALDELDQESLG